MQAYIDFEISEGEYERTRQLYERLLDRTKHLKVWISYAKFEASVGMEDEEVGGESQESSDDISHHEQQLECIQRCRGTLDENEIKICFVCNFKMDITSTFFLLGVFERAFDYFRTAAPELKDERAMLLEEWLNIESSFGNLGDVTLVQKKLPRKVKRKRAISTEDGTPAGYAHCLLFSVFLITFGS